jgi:hypothetical protein
MADNSKALPNIFPKDQSISDLKAAIREVDVHSITALKDLTRAFNSQKKKIDSLEREIKVTESNVSDIEAALEQNTNQLASVQTIQNKILTQIEKLEQVFSEENIKLERKLSEQNNELNHTIKELSRKVDQVEGGGSILPLGLGAKAAKTAKTAEAAASKKTLAALVPTLAKGTMRAIGGAIATFATDIVSSLAEATGHPQIAAGADILGDTIVGASLGGLVGPAGAVLGGLAGAAYGAYDKGGQLLGSTEISPQIKELQQQADERTAGRQREEARIQQLHQEKPELANFEGGAPPQVVAGGGNVNLGPIKGTGQGYEAAGVSKAEIVEYIKAAASKRGIDPNTAVRVAQSEGLNIYIGDRGSSFGPYQLHYGGVAGGGMAVGGLGDSFTRKTSLDARDPKTWKQQVDFSLDEAKRGGWGPWHGAQRVGIGNWQGLKGGEIQTQKSSPASLLGSSASTLPAIANMTGTPTSTNVVAPQNVQVGKTGVMGGTGMSFDPKQKQGGGDVPHGDIVALGKWLQSQGVNVSEHPAFGGVLGTHVKGSAHYRNEAIDINGPPGTVEANDPVWGKKFDQLAEQIRAAGYKVIWRASGHFNHLHAQLSGGGSPGDQAAPENKTGIPQQATQPTPEAPQVTAPPMGAAIGSSGMAGMEAQLMGNPMMMLSGMGIGGGMAGMVAGMLTPMLMNALSSSPDMMSAQLQSQKPQTAQLVPTSINEAPITPYDEAVAEEPAAQVNNINVMGGQNGKSVSTGLPQNQVMMNARPDWLGQLAEGLLGATYTGMSRPKYFGTGTGKM